MSGIQATVACLAVFFGWAVPASAQLAQPHVTARFEQSTVSVGEQARLWIEIRGECAADAELMPFPEIAGLEFRERSGPHFSVQSQSTGRGAGDQTIATYELAVLALAVGEYDIRALSVLCQSDMAVLSNPVFLRVVDPAVGAAAVAFRLEPEPSRVYAREPFRVQVRLELDTRIARELTSSNSRFVFPWWDDVVVVSEQGRLGPGQKRFEIEGSKRSLLLDQQSTRVVRRDGLFYEVLTGELIVLAPEPAELSLAGSKFQVDSDQVGGATAAARTVAVRAVPRTGRPGAYRDAVGDFALEAVCDRASVTVGETVQVTLTLRELRPGATNIRFTDFGPFDRIEGFRLFGRESVREPGRRIARLELAPQTDAVRQIPAFEFVWFDPEDGRFHRAETAPIPLEVRPHPEGKQLLDPNTGGAPPPSPYRWPFYTLALVLALIFLRTVRKQRRPTSAASAPTAREALRSFQTAHARLRAETGSDPLEEARLLARYLAARLGAEPGRCFGEGVRDLLLARAVDRPLADDVLAYFEAVEQAVFSGSTSEASDPGALEALVDRLEAESWESV